MNESFDSFLTVDEACDFLRIRKSWLYQNHEHTGMPSHRIGRKLVFKKSELAEWVTSGSQF
jgi:hypothetical protein